ncbi:tRNA glutamyl-Q(34) synthetase GluQRS [Reinekea forsetii]|nr:tRNA glutamyl-Q(34) synthetase GluQRS [Reinekea forsetii]
MRNYRGRFAPTPSGPLHFGSLFAAVVSYLEAKHHHGQWLVRIDDIDPPREQPGASISILKTLEAHGLCWDEPVVYQSKQSELYESRLAELYSQDALFWCQCSRKSLANHIIYPGTCRIRKQPVEHSAIRVCVELEQDTFHDLFQGLQTCNPKLDFGDVILKRKDGLYAYQLAAAADDVASGITHVIRGIDLLPSTWWQRTLMKLWHEPPPSYGHFAVIHSADSDQKLSKQNLASAIINQRAEENLQSVFSLLGLNIEPANCEVMLKQAVSLFQSHNLTKKHILRVPNLV